MQEIYQEITLKEALQIVHEKHQDESNLYIELKGSKILKSYNNCISFNKEQLLKATYYIRMED